MLEIIKNALCGDFLKNFDTDKGADKEIEDSEFI